MEIWEDKKTGEQCIRANNVRYHDSNTKVYKDDFVIFYLMNDSNPCVLELVTFLKNYKPVSII